MAREAKWLRGIGEMGEWGCVGGEKSGLLGACRWFAGQEGLYELERGGISRWKRGWQVPGRSVGRVPLYFGGAAVGEAFGPVVK